MIKTGVAEGMTGIKKVQGEIDADDRVDETHRIFGPFDILARVETETVEDLTKLIDKIRRIEGVNDTDTYLSH